jgi:predicted type IV restriction endonuclease
VAASRPETLRQVAGRAPHLRGRRIGEQDTKATLIERILRALGWNIEDVEEVGREYFLSAQTNNATASRCSR